MKMALFHFMNMLRLPIMFATKVFLWIAAFGMIMAWGEYFGWFSVPINSKSDPLTMAVIGTFLAAGVYYFRWQYDVVLVLLNPNGSIIAYAKGASIVASQNEVK